MNDYDQLAPYYDAEWRNLTQDIPFILDEAHSAGDPILELACGSGRVALPLALAGFSVWGIDNSPAMLSLFEKKILRESPDVSSRIHISKQDMQKFSFDQRFKLILIPFNSFLLLTDRQDFDQCLQNCKNHLDDSGKFIIDVFSPNFELCAIKEPKMQFLQHFYVPELNKVVIQWEYAKRDMGRQLIDIDFLYEEYDRNGNLENKTYSLQMSIVFRYEMEYLLEKNGFTVEAVYGNYDRSPFTNTSPQIICVCGK
jgi:SAM-dependent methyltransferase